MSRQRIALDSWESQLNHRKKVTAKLQKIQTLQALLQEWESNPNPDHAYILELRRKLRSLEHQYNAMQP
jgi:hypothetical protein